MRRDGLSRKGMAIEEGKGREHVGDSARDYVEVAFSLVCFIVTQDSVVQKKRCVGFGVFFCIRNVKIDLSTTGYERPYDTSCWVLSLRLYSHSNQSK